MGKKTIYLENNLEIDRKKFFRITKLNEDHIIKYGDVIIKVNGITYSTKTT